MIQRCTIADWLPSMSANGSHGHWRSAQKQHDTDMHTTYGALLYAGWKRVESKARLRITLVFSVRRRRDTDNLYYRCKGVIDGIKPFLVDDDTEHLEIVPPVVLVERGRRGVELELESA